MTGYPDACFCLLEPGTAEKMDERDRDIAAKITGYGWASRGVLGDDQSPPWAYSIGLWHTFRSPEVSVFGLPYDVGMEVVNVLGGLVRDGERLRPGRRGDVLNGYDVSLRPAHPGWYPQFFGTALDFYVLPPVPIVQALWPDTQGRFPGDDGAPYDEQPMLWLPPDQHPPSLWTQVDPYFNWPFRTSLPYFPARTTQAVIDGTAPVTSVVRADDGSWTFSDGIFAADATSTLRHILALHPYVAEVADLDEGERADRDGDAWTRR
ncbi:DUF4262 domain-containing protein [Actinoplanes sp. NPDC051633]|uniref:DUF4262 domain-containing protein n=1 Tax=Actinoplanes sp. NPDC051633 TaxID=3155670 RepID=UPI0034468644